MTDLKTGPDNDLVITEGDLVITESTLQHQADILWAEKGWWHFRPDLGVALQQWLNESGSAPTLVRIIRQEMERDGATVESIKITNDNINVDAYYGTR